MSKVEDINLIEKGITHVFDKSLSSIFKNEEIFKNICIISFDDNNIYAFQYKKNEILLNKIPHKEKILDDTKKGWSANLRQKGDLKKYLPQEYLKMKIISGGLFSDFSKLQSRKNSIYISEESYIATIIHEYAHIYFNTLNPFYYADKEYNIKILNIAKDIYSEKNINNNFNILLPSIRELSEVFAFCVEYEFAKKYAKQYYNDLSKSLSKDIERLIIEEEKKDLNREDSVLYDSHILSWVLGRVILEKYPNDWHERLLKRFKI